MKTKEFNVGDEVRYIPTHANGDSSHKDCENGIVTSVNDKKTLIFVKYYRNGMLQNTAELTSPIYLLLVKKGG